MKLPVNFREALIAYTFGWRWGKEYLGYQRRYRRPSVKGAYKGIDGPYNLEFDGSGRKAVKTIDELVEAIGGATEVCEHYVTQATYPGTVEKHKFWDYADIDSDGPRFHRKIVWDCDPAPGTDSIIEELDRLRQVQSRFTFKGKSPFLTYSSGRGLYLVGWFYDTVRTSEEWRPLPNPQVVKRIWLLIALEFGLMVDMGVYPSSKARVTKVPYTRNLKTAKGTNAIYISRRMTEAQVQAAVTAPEMVDHAHFDFPTPLEFHDLLQELDRPELSNEQLWETVKQMVISRRRCTV